MAVKINKMAITTGYAGNNPYFARILIFYSPCKHMV